MSMENMEKKWPVQKTPDYMPSVYGVVPEMRGYELEDMVSVKIKDLFPCMPDNIYNKDGDDLTVIDRYTRDALKSIDIEGMISADDSVNICCAEHGFCLWGGKPYLQMLKTIKQVVKERTGCRDIRLRLVMYRTPKECEEAMEYYNLMEEFENNVDTVCCYDKAVPIQTRVGTLYGLEKAYDADKFIYAYYDDPREVYAHRMFRKSFKAFTMNMARFETRSAFHQNFGDANAAGAAPNLIPTAIFDSDFIQSKYTFSCFMRSSPNGLYGIDADKDLYALDDRIMTSSLRYYAMPYHLLRSLHDVTCVVDGGRWDFYMHCGGIISGVYMCGSAVDSFDLDARYPRIGEDPTITEIAGPAAVKSFVINQAWYGINSAHITMFAPTYMVGDMYEKYRLDPTNRYMTMSPNCHKVDTLPEAIERATQDAGGKRKILVFDGSFGFMTCSKEMAEELVANAPAIQKLVDEELYPKYMKQRGLEIPK